MQIRPNEAAGDFTIYARIALPPSKAGMATVELFMARGYRNDWYNAMMFIDAERTFPLQYFLNSILTKATP